MISITRVAAAPTVWMATPDGLVCIDLIAIERAANGLREGWTLTEDEARYAASLLFEREMPYSVIARRLGISSAKIRAWFPDLAVPADECMSRTGTRKTSPRPAAACGTRQGYGGHHRRGEAPCKPCKAAYAAADRHYRTHGTYVVAPEVTA